MRRRCLGGRVMRAVIYCRVSTAEQQTLEEQESSCRAFCESRGWEIVDVVTEYASGAKQRPARDALLERAKKEQLAVVVWKLDRFGRSTSDLVESLDSLADAGGTFASVTEALDLSTPAGRLLRTMLAGVAEFERDMIRERTRAALRAAKARGNRTGPKGLGTRPGEGMLLKRTVELRDAGLTQYEIASVLNEEGHTTRRGTPITQAWVSSALSRTQKDAI